MADDLMGQLPKHAQDEIQKHANRPVVLSIGVLMSLLGSVYGYGQTTQRIKTLEEQRKEDVRVQRRANELFDDRLRNIEIASGVPAKKRRPSIKHEVYGEDEH